MAPDDWLTTDETADYIGGVRARWVRLQIERHRLVARAFLTADGRVSVYRVRRRDVDAFLATWSRDSRDLDR